MLSVSNPERTEYRVVDFPLPVGPVTNTTPCGSSITLRKVASVDGRKPSLSNPIRTPPTSITRITTFSPNFPGNVETRKSIGRPFTRTLISPSCGTRRSEMSRRAIIFTRLAIAECIRCGGLIRTCSTPSTRKRTRNWPSSGSM